MEEGEVRMGDKRERERGRRKVMNKGRKKFRKLCLHHIWGSPRQKWNIIPLHIFQPSSTHCSAELPLMVGLRCSL